MRLLPKRHAAGADLRLVKAVGAGYGNNKFLAVCIKLCFLFRCYFLRGVSGAMPESFKKSCVTFLFKSPVKNSSAVMASLPFFSLARMVCAKVSPLIRGNKSM